MYYGLDPSRSAAPTYAPQGFFGDLISQVAAPIGSTIGGWAGNQQLGQQIGGLAGGVAKLIPFEAGPSPVYAPMPVSYAPQSAAYAPQGFFGDLVSQIAPPLADKFAHYVGVPQLSPGLGSLASGAAKMIPFEAAPTAAYAPQGLFGGLLGGPVGGWIGGAIGDAFGNRSLGEQIGSAAGTIGGGVLPFQAAPSPYFGAIR